MQNNTQHIRYLNDQFRQQLPQQGPIQGKVVLTQGIQALLEAPTALADLLALVRDYSDFNAYNDPYGEHDFGSFTFSGQTCFWKVDYYTPDLAAGSDDPSDTVKTTRVLTIMLAGEY